MIATLKTELLIHHPKNPRKELGDLTELADSIKTNGVMQNLTVIPVTDEMEKFYVLMGNRRLAAGKMAGIREFPCRIVEDLSDKEQIALMLEENMQRNDLTITEQADSFQLMMDLGSTVEEIKEKTGFSESTIYHRLNLAKLDATVLKQREDSESFQLNLKDLYELEKIKDIDARNRILKNAYKSNDIKIKVEQELKVEKRKKTAVEITKELEAGGIKKAPEGAEPYSVDWDIAASIYIDTWRPETFDFDSVDPEKTFWQQGPYYVYLLTKGGIEVETEQDRRQKEKEKKRQKMSKALNEMKKKRCDFCKSFIKLEEVDEDSDHDLCERVLPRLLKRGVWLDINDLARYLKVTNTTGLMYSPPGDILLAAMCRSLDSRNPVSYDLSYQKWEGEWFKEAYEVLEAEGLDVTEEERQIIDGTHELYKKEN